MVAFGGSPKIKGSIGLLIEQRVKHFGIAFAVDVRIPVPTSGSDAGLRSVSIKIALSFHPALPPQNSFIIKLHADTFDEESPETTLFPWLSPLLLPPSKTLFSFVLAYFSPASYITVVFFLLHILLPPFPPPFLLDLPVNFPTTSLPCLISSHSPLSYFLTSYLLPTSFSPSSPPSLPLHFFLCFLVFPLLHVYFLSFLLRFFPDF